ncbi:MAG: hypothetical protein CVU33_17350 [Betaproteobacteria bacterium HGW-Betaproteobacteria-6]|jgi:hypothetical protein|nr:MAG: hypothetical protein CVU33_17350 [Betaproteobacteria bacterium HGW-Betaproteobacteria-6]
MALDLAPFGRWTLCDIAPRSTGQLNVKHLLLKTLTLVLGTTPPLKNAYRPRSFSFPGSEPQNKTPALRGRFS